MKELQNRRKAALQSIEETSRMLSSTKKTTLSTLNKLNLLTAEIKTRRRVINSLNDEIGVLNTQQREISQTIKELEKELALKKKDYAKAIQGMSRRDTGYGKLMFIFSASTVNQSYRRIRYLQEYSAWRKKQGMQISAKQTELHAKKEELLKTMRAKSQLLGERTTETNKLKVQEDKQKDVVTDLKKKEKSLKGELAKQQRQADNLDRRIEQLIAEEARKAAEEAARQEAARQAAAARKAATQKGGEKKSDTEQATTTTSVARKADTKGGYAMTKVEKELSNSFENNKGRLPFPLSGSYMIVGHFGQQQHQELKYVKLNNNGIDLQTKSGTQARSVFNGVVTRVFVMPGYNSSVIIRHGNYLTIYSNLSDVYVKAGDKVTTRQSIGKIYSDPEDDDRTVLHFQLWKETTKLNPELWLDR